MLNGFSKDASAREMAAEIARWDSATELQSITAGEFLRQREVALAAAKEMQAAAKSLESAYVKMREAGRNASACMRLCGIPNGKQDQEMKTWIPKDISLPPELLAMVMG